MTMKKLFTLAMLVLAAATASAQKPQVGGLSSGMQFTKEQQELVDLSNQKWAWMAEKNADALSKLFLDSAMFVHMGGSWGAKQEVDIIRGGMIWYKHADIHSQEVKFLNDGTAVVYSNIHLTSEVGGHEVCFPFMVSEVFVKQEEAWKLGALIFTKLMEPGKE